MATRQRPVRYILMPEEGVTDERLAAATLQPSGQAIALHRRAAVAAQPQMKVIDQLHENGMKLVEMSPEAELAFRLSVPGVRVVPEVFYQPARHRPEVAEAVRRLARAGTVARAAEITVVDKDTGAPLPGAGVLAFVDYAGRVGAQAHTDRRGRARFTGLSATRALERLYVYGPPNYWGFYATDTTLRANAVIALPRVDVADPKLLLHQLYGAPPPDAGAGVTIAIVDTGVDGRHPDLTNVAGGANCVRAELRANPNALSDWGPARTDGEHGTHVAGIAAARGAGSGFRGVAPGAALRSYRVFPHVGGGASSFDIAGAIDRAVADGCDILNLSLGGGAADPATRAAIGRALAAGAVVVAAAGNDDRAPVSNPAADPQCVAVSAMGRRGAFPGTSTGRSDIAAPFAGPSRRDFVAAFSNIGIEIDVIGPGVEIVSTLPGEAHGPMSGTSMAAPAIAGFAARLLAADPALRATRGAARSRGLKDLLYSKARPLGFGRTYEGFGLPG